MNRGRLRLSAVAGVVGLLVAACGDGGAEPGSSPGPANEGQLEAVITSSDLAVGSQRFAFVLIKDDTPVSEEVIAVRFFKLKDENKPVLVGEGAIPYSPLGIPGLTTAGSEIGGVYYANVEFDEPGKWGAGFTIGPKADAEKEVRLAFEVKPKTATVAVGQKAVPVDNPTLKNAPLRQIDTSPEPDEPFHQISVAEALNAGKPSVIAFATPAFCESRTCGPTMDIVRAAHAKYGDKANWVHVEPFKLDENGKLLLSGGEKVNSDAGNQWRLPSEPWVFLVDKAGVVVARFDGPVTLEELEFYLDRMIG